MVNYLLSKKQLVMATTRDTAKFEAAGIKDENLKIVRLDITSESEVKKAIAEIMENYGRIDVLVNNAGFGFIGAIEEALQAIYAAGNRKSNHRNGITGTSP